jgi:hypothetical protein
MCVYGIGLDGKLARFAHEYTVLGEVDHQVTYVLESGPFFKFVAHDNDGVEIDETKN